jgi:hypothetical protein
VKPLLLVGGPFDLDGTEVPDNHGTVRCVPDGDGKVHTYYVLRDFTLDRWVGQYWGVTHDDD